MSTHGIDSVMVATHNWGKAAKFFQTLGYELEFETDHNSGQFRCGDGPYIFVAEVPETVEAAVQIVFKVADADAFRADGLDVVSGFADTHWGTREMVVRDPDGRTWSLQAPQKTGD